MTFSATMVAQLSQHTQFWQDLASLANFRVSPHHHRGLPPAILAVV